MINRNKPDNISVLVINCRSLDARIEDIRLLAEKCNPDLMCLTETWLNNEKVTKYKYNIKGYNSTFQHRLDRMGGGLATYIKQEMCFSKANIRNYGNGNLEVQILEIGLKNNQIITILNYYNPNKDVSIAELEHYVQNLPEPFLMVGDLNSHTDILMQGDISNITGKNLELLLLRNEICIINPINFYTYMDPRTARTSCLDVCLCSPQMIASTNITRLDGVGSDHYPILTSNHATNSYPKHTKKTSKIEP